MEKWNSKFDILKVTLTVDDQYKERWASPGTFNMLASAQVTKIIIQGILSKKWLSVFQPLSSFAEWSFV